MDIKVSNASSMILFIKETGDKDYSPRAGYTKKMV